MVWIALNRQLHRLDTLLRLVHVNQRDSLVEIKQTGCRKLFDAVVVYLNRLFGLAHQVQGCAIVCIHGRMIRPLFKVF